MVMTEKLKRVERTVIDLFGRLENAGIRYAVLRNYENYPHFSHDVDLVLYKSDISRLREILGSLSGENGWDMVTECSHWSVSKHEHHNIEVFRFYHAEEKEYLQVDIFHGFVLWGLPLMDEKALLLDSVLDEKGFRKINPAKENLLRMLQVYRLNDSPKTNSGKIERYTKMITSYADDYGSEFVEVLERFFPVNGKAALESLSSGEIDQFRSSMLALKKRYLWWSIKNNPSQVMSCIMSRAWDYFKQYMHEPCGAVLKVYASASEKDEIRHCLEALKQKNILFCWKESEGVLDISRFSVLERGGLVIYWTDKKNADLVMGDIVDVNAWLIHFLKHRHPTLVQGK